MVLFIEVLNLVHLKQLRLVQLKPLTGSPSKPHTQPPLLTHGHNSYRKGIDDIHKTSPTTLISNSTPLHPPSAPILRLHLSTIGVSLPLLFGLERESSSHPYLHLPPLFFDLEEESSSSHHPTEALHSTVSHPQAITSNFIPQLHRMPFTSLLRIKRGEPLSSTMLSFSTIFFRLEEESPSHPSCHL